MLLVFTETTLEQYSLLPIHYKHRLTWSTTQSRRSQGQHLSIATTVFIISTSQMVIYHN